LRDSDFRILRAPSLSYFGRYLHALRIPARVMQGFRPADSQVSRLRSRPVSLSTPIAEQLTIDITN